VYEDYRQQPQQQHATTVITTQQPHNNHVAQQQTDFKDYPVAIKCPTCHQEVLTF